MESKPDGYEVMATSLPSSSYVGWYCSNHPNGEQIANGPSRERCWGCGEARPPELKKA
jgi:hypothetical protein